MANSAYVSTGKPKVGGAIYRAPKGTPLPTSATEDLNAAFVDMGFVSEDGVTNGSNRESEDIKAWGGVTVLSSQTDISDTWQAVFIEALNVNVLKMVFGANNVTGNVDAGIEVKVNAEESEEASYVFDMILKGRVLKRVVLPSAKMSSLGDIVYKDNEAIAYDVTLTALPDEKENMHYEYIITAASPDPDPTTTFTVTFNTDGGTDIPAQTVTEGDIATKPADPDKDGYTFVDWYTDDTFTDVYDFASPVTADITIYAKFE